MPVGADAVLRVQDCRPDPSGDASDAGSTDEDSDDGDDDSESESDAG